MYPIYEVRASNLRHNYDRMIAGKYIPFALQNLRTAAAVKEPIIIYFGDPVKGPYGTLEITNPQQVGSEMYYSTHRSLPAAYALDMMAQMRGGYINDTSIHKLTCGAIVVSTAGRWKRNVKFNTVSDALAFFAKRSKTAGRLSISSSDSHSRRLQIVFHAGKKRVDAVPHEGGVLKKM